MRTLITSGHARDVVAQRITQAQASAVCAGLGTPVSADVGFDGTVHLRARGPVTTEQEVAALAAMLAVTDAVRWHKAVAPC